jgi:PKD repeat protein
VRTDRNRRLLAVTTAIVLVFSAVGIVFADTLSGDADALTVGNQTNVFLDAADGLTQTFHVALSIDCVSTLHMFGNVTVCQSSSSTTPSDGVLIATSVAIGKPIGWPSDLDPCGVAASTNSLDSAVSVTAPSTAGDWTFQLRWAVSDSDVHVGSAEVAIHFHVAGATVPDNNPPTVDAGGPYSGPEGSPIAINGASASDGDAGDSIASYSWTKSETGFDAGYSCTLSGAATINPSVSCTDNGSVTLTLTVADTHGGTNSDDATVSVGNANPVAGSATLAAGADTCSVNLGAGFTDAGVNDTHTASVAWGDTTSSAGAVTETAQSGSGTVAATHAYATIGSYTANLTVTDDNGGAGTSGLSNSLLAGYKTGGILQPINPGPPSSIFKWGSTIPVKIQVTNCNGSVPTGLSLYITIKAVSPNTPPTGDYEVASTSAADTGNLMRFSSPQYIYNLYTKTPYFPDPTATYTLSIHYGSSAGPTIASAVIGLRN